MSRDRVPPHRFALEREDSVWEGGPGGLRLVSSTAEAGESSVDESGILEGRDQRAERQGHALPWGEALAALSRRVTIRVRTVHERIDVEGSGGAESRERRYATIRLTGASPASLLVPFDSGREPIRSFLDRLVAPPKVAPLRPLPILWTGGTAAVLFHEAAGHPAEHGAAPVGWPSWLAVRDDPSAGPHGAMRLDDAGRAVAAADLLTGPPRCARREGWRDAPLPRMTNLVVTHEDAPFELPANRIEVVLLDGGQWEPLSDQVHLHIARAFLVEGAKRRHLAPFAIRVPRARLATALLGARGTPEAYPGVLCRDEGQRIPVGSFACEILTESLA